jgi:hypothetical protein
MLAGISRRRQIGGRMSASVTFRWTIPPPLFGFAAMVFS